MTASPPRIPPVSCGSCTTGPLRSSEGALPRRRGVGGGRRRAGGHRHRVALVAACAPRRGPDPGRGGAGRGAVAAVLKLIVDRPRPAASYRLLAETDPSFPSGHATGTMALGVSAALIVAVYLLRRPLARAIVIALGVAWPLAVAASRLELGVHWPTDVVAGLALGASVALGRRPRGPSGWQVCTARPHRAAPAPAWRSGCARRRPTARAERGRLLLAEDLGGPEARRPGRREGRRRRGQGERTDDGDEDRNAGDRRIGGDTERDRRCAARRSDRAAIRPECRSPGPPARRPRPGTTPSRRPGARVKPSTRSNARSCRRRRTVTISVSTTTTAPINARIIANARGSDSTSRSRATSGGGAGVDTSKPARSERPHALVVRHAGSEPDHSTRERIVRLEPETLRGRRDHEKAARQGGRVVDGRQQRLADHGHPLRTPGTGEPDVVTTT